MQRVGLSYGSGISAIGGKWWDGRACGRRSVELTVVVGALHHSDACESERFVDHWGFATKSKISATSKVVTISKISTTTAAVADTTEAA